jgi:lipid A 4'-phosphatase
MKKLIVLGLVTLSLSLLFICNPEVDLAVSRLFFSEEHGKFLLAKNSILSVVAKLAFILAALVLSINTLSIINRFFKTRSFNFQLYKKEIFVILVFIMGSIFLIQGFVKPYFGRARPHKIHEFGGKLEFSPAFTVSKQCRATHSPVVLHKLFNLRFSNCSFVSFHTSLGFVLISYAMIVSHKRRFFMIIASSFTVLFMITRVLQGKHFLSDVIFSACMMLILMNVLSLLLKIREDHPKSV